MTGIDIQGISMRFGDLMALDDVSLSLKGERIYGLLGRNGAGKSTLLNIITNRLFATKGTVTIDGIPAMENDKAQGRIYMAGEVMTHPPTMRVSDIFRFSNMFYQGAMDMAFADKLCQQFGLNTKKRVRQLSTGYKTIYRVIAALSLRIPYILLDEPVLGLDANHRDLLYKTIIESYADNPRTIVISTHLIEEVAPLIEEVIIIKQGRVIEQQTCEALLAMGYTVAGPATAVDAYCAGKQVIGQDALGGLKTAYVLGKPDTDSLPSQLEVSRMDLQKLFIQLTNE